MLPNARAKGRGRTKLGETGQSITPRPLERRVGPRAGTILRPPTEPKTKAGGPAWNPGNDERGDGGRTACTTPGWNTGGLEQTDTPRTTTKAQKSTWCKRMLSLPAQPRPNNAVDPAARRAFALSSTRPTTALRGAGGRSQNNEWKYNPASPRTPGWAADWNGAMVLAFRFFFIYHWRVLCDTHSTLRALTAAS